MFSSIAKNPKYEFETSDDLKAMIHDKAREQGFAVAIRSSTPGVRFLLKCLKGGEYRNTHSITEESRKRKKKIVQSGCKWTLSASFSKKTLRWGVRQVHNHSEESEHNHPMDTDPELDMEQPPAPETIELPTIPLPITNPIFESMNGSISTGFPTNLSSIMEPYDVRTVSIGPERSFKEIIKFLADKNFSTRYNTTPTKDLKSLFLMHLSSMEKASQFPEVVLIDTTHNFNMIGMPLINIVGVNNLGSNKLSSFLIASALVSDEEQDTFKWVLRQLRDAILNWCETSLFVIEEDEGLLNAIKEVFPESRQSFCAWHMERRFMGHVSGCFSDKRGSSGSDTTSRTMFKNHVKRMLYTRSEDEFENAIRDCRRMVQDTPKAQDFGVYLDEQLLRKELWGGPWVEKLVHLGCRTAQRVRGAHSAIKYGMEKPKTLMNSIKAIDGYVSRSLAKEYKDLAVESLKIPVTILSYPVEFSGLKCKVSSFALYAIKDELAALKALGSERPPKICECSLKINYLLPCRHSLIVGAPIPLESIHKRWHLQSFESISFWTPNS